MADRGAFNKFTKRTKIVLQYATEEARAFNHPYIGTDQDLTTRAQRVIEYAVEETKRLNHHYIGTEHLLLGLVRNGEGVATGVLEIMGVSLEQIRTQVNRYLRQGPAGPPERSAQPKQSKTPYLDALSTD